MKNFFFKTRLFLPITIKQKKKSINLGLIIVVIIASIFSWFLTEYAVYQLNQMDLVSQEIWISEIRPEARAQTEVIGLVRQDCTGYDNCFTSLSQWEANYGGIDFGACPQGDLVCADKIAIAKIDGAWSSADTIAVTIDDWTTSAANYIKIYTTTAARHSGKWGANAYRLEVAAGIAFNTLEDHLTVEGLQIKARTTTFGDTCIGADTAGTGVHYYGYNILQGGQSGINIGGGGTSPNTYWYNNIIYGFSDKNSLNYGNHYVYNCVFKSDNTGTTGLRTYQGTLTVSNTASFNNGDDFYNNGGTLTINNSASDDGDGINSVTPSDWTAVFVNHTNGDFHLLSTDTNLKDAGTTNPSNGLFLDDIDGEARTGSWDIGADEEGGTPPQTCLQAGGTCYSNQCSTYTSCSPVSGTCATGYCCSGTCTTPTPDTTPPTTPTNLTATSISSSQINLSWTASTDNVGVTGYKIYRDTILIDNSTTNSYSNTGLSPNTTYTYTISAYDAIPNTSSQSSSAQATTQSLPVPDTTPPASVTNLSVSSCASNSCDLSWTAPGDDNNTGTATTYNIRYSTANITESNWNSANQVSNEPNPQIAGTIETHTVTGLLSNTTYYFAIKTSDEVPNESGLGNVAIDTTLASTGNVYYLAPDGNDSNIGTIGQPWKTLYKACQTLVAGDTVYLRGGTYPGYGSTMEHGATPLNSGTAGNPITFAAYPGETAIIRPTVDYSHAGFRLNTHSYITIDGLEMSHCVRGVYIKAGYLADHIIVKNCHIHDSDTLGGGNGGGIYALDGVDCQFLNNVFHDNRGPSTNACGIIMYDMLNTTIRGNIIYNQTGVGIFVKKRNSNCDVSQNIIYDSHYGIWCGTSSDNCDFYENIFYNCTSAFASGVGTITTGTKIYNNVMIGGQRGIGIHDNTRNLIIYNNIISGTNQCGICRPYGTDGTIAYIGHNNKYNCNEWCEVGLGENSIQLDPEFVNAVGHDYHLQASSPCKGAGRYGEDMGAYPGAVSSDTTPPTGSIIINSGDANTNSQNVNLSLSASDSSGVSQMKISNTNNFSSIAAEAYNTIKQWTLSTGDGLKTVYAWFKDTANNWNTSPYSDTITLDTASPIISNISVSNINTSSANISFNTSEQTTSYIEYGLTASYGSQTTENSSPLSSFTIQLSNLSDNTTYHYRITSTDQTGNASQSTDQTFTTTQSIIPDTTPPSNISNLSSSNIAQTSADLSWTSPGDDNNTGTASEYNIRYSTSNITNDTEFNSAAQASGEPIPQTAGNTQSMTIVGLNASTQYYFAVKTRDEVPNWSEISNILSITTLEESTPPPVTPPSGGGGGAGAVSDTTPPSQPSEFTATGADKQIILTWANPTDSDFVRVLIVKKQDGAPTSKDDGEIIYEGTEQEYTDIELNNNAVYYYAIFAYDKKPNYSNILTISAQPEAGKAFIEKPQKSICFGIEVNNLFGLGSNMLECICLREAKTVDEHNQFVALDNTTLPIYEKIIKSDYTDLAIGIKYSIAMFIHYGTKATKILGAGERAGVVNSYRFAFNKLPQTISDWQDIIKIANGRWPANTSEQAESKAKQEFRKVYLREPDMVNPNDNAAVTVIAYGLRPVNRNMENEKAGIRIFNAIYGYDPVGMADWDVVRAIAYSGAAR